MPKITSIAGNVVKIVDDDIIAVDSPMEKKRKIEVNPKQSNKPGKVSFTSYVFYMTFFLIVKFYLRS